MRALQAFEAAARHLNFTRAAVELNLTQTAISHQIRNLEDSLGTALFRREGGGLQLTVAGESYLLSARHVISEISVATERIGAEQRDDTLTVACLGTFQIKSLLPRIADFRARHPDLVLRFKTLVPNAPPIHWDFDVAFQYGVGEWPEMTAHRLGGETVFPVCSPGLLKNGPPLTAPADLALHTIIRTGSPLLVRDDWPFWLQRAGVPGLTFAREMSCDLLYPAFQAAIEGLGIVMGRSAVVGNDIAAGRLVDPFGLRLPSPSSYFLLVPHGRESLPKVSAFASWALETFAHQQDITE